MKPNIFMSYSRREVGFVDDLTHRLEQHGYQVWLDYRSLVPGTPWAGQIDKGLDESEVVLLVVSKDSLASKYVEMEWRRVLKENKRVILLIFEAVDLPVELGKFEWVDFRGSYEAGIKELVGQLESPVQEEHPAPETGFKVPGVVWLAFGLSLVAAFISLYCLWSLFVPFFLLPLPYRLFKRDFNLTQVQAALWLLPVILFLTSVASQGINDPSGDLTGPSLVAIELFVISIPVVPLLVLVLRSKGMRRWGKPEASLEGFADLYKPENRHPQPVPFFIDFALQDQRIADEMARIFKKYDHPQATEIQSARAVFVLLSEFKNNTQADPESQMVFPVMVQTCKPADKLSKVQWIDFRGGVRHLDSMAELLPEPAKLLSALGVRPTGDRMVLPPIIMSMYYFLVLLCIFILGSNLKNGYEYPKRLLEALPQTIVTLALIFGLLFWMNRGLLQRKGWLASFTNFSLALVGLGVLTFAQLIVYLINISDVTKDFSNAVAYPAMGYLIGMLVMSIFLAFRYRDVRLWFPARPPKQAKSPSRLPALTQTDS